ncbi:MAG: hypothetical protein A2133_07890 [Actinobacteria bacterium RBG_16_64_13]|nr:MAG: hypothetical protein A2133_07890 [Actinobacteria bacterium RBG_16_64_13]
MWGGGFGMGAEMVIWAVIWLAMLAFIVAGIVLLVRGAGHRDNSQAGTTQGPPPGDTQGRTPLRILEERYAGGEIDREEFLKRKADLQS